MSSFDCPKYCANLCDSSFGEMLIFNAQTSVYYPGVNYPERALITKYPKEAVKVFIAKNEAETIAKKIFNRNVANDESDAIRHNGRI